MSGFDTWNVSGLQLELGLSIWWVMHKSTSEAHALGNKLHVGLGHS